MMVLSYHLQLTTYLTMTHAIPPKSNSDADQKICRLSDESEDEGAPCPSEEVAVWAIGNKCMRAAVNELLDIFRQQGHRLPMDTRILLQTPKKVETVERCSGHCLLWYCIWHFKSSRSEYWFQGR